MTTDLPIPAVEGPPAVGQSAEAPPTFEPIFHDEAAYVGRALREARGDVLSPDAVARVRASLMAAGIAADAPQGPAPRSPLAKLLGATRLRVGLVGLGVVGLGIAGVAGFAVRRT